MARQLGADLRRELERARRRFGPLFGELAQSPRPQPSVPGQHGHCIVHYRVGDYLTLAGANQSAISPYSVASAVASFSPLPVTVELLGGGIDWLSPSSTDQSVASVVSRSRSWLHQLRHAIRALLPPSTRLLGPSPRPADVDFVRMADAELLVLAGGSFGLAAALAGRRGQQVRLPAADHQLDVFRTRRAPRAADKGARWPDGWREYSFELVPIS